VGAGVAAVAALATGARADWIQTFGIGERSALLGGAVTASADDYAAWYYNPGGAGGLERPLLAASARVIDTRALVFRDAEGDHHTDATTRESEVAVAPTVGGYLPLGALESLREVPYADRVVLGLGFGAPFAITADWSDRGFHRFNSRNQSLFVLELAPTLAVRLTERLSIGATLDWVAFNKLRIDAFLGDGFVGQAASFATGEAVPPQATIDGSDDGTLSLQTGDSSHLGVGQFDPDFGSAGVTVGVRYRAREWLSLGVVYREETPVVFEGDVALRIDPSATFGALPATSRSGYRLALEMPRHLQGGFAWDVADRIATWSVDLQWTQWSAASGLGSPAPVRLSPGLVELPAALAPALQPANPAARAEPGDAIRTLVLDYDMRDTLAVRTGVEWHVAPAVDLLFGYVYDPSVVSESHLDAVSFSSDRHLASAGVAYRRGKPEGCQLALVLGFQAVVYESRRVGEGRSQNLGGLATYQDADGDFGTLNFAANRDAFASDRSDGRPITGAVEFGGLIWAAGLSVQGRF
jgi:long-chain fatty acid transport protein